MSINPRLILVVEDDAATREVVRDVLDGEGYCVVTAANGYEALAELRARSSRPSVILLDLKMPIMDGWAFRGEQLKDRSLRAIPVVVLSADAAARAKAVWLRAAGYLRKPLRLDDLLRTVERYSLSGMEGALAPALLAAGAGRS
jgi:CheY-like chemotaxis protein